MDKPSSLHIVIHINKDNPMNFRYLTLIAACTLLAACALTPEQQAAREAAQKQYQQQLQVQLAAQCNPATAAVMQEYFTSPPPADEKARQAFRLRYVEKVNDPMFQACYKMAWQNHIAQQQIREMQRYYDRPNPFYPWHHPFWW